MRPGEYYGAIISPCQRYRYRLWRYWYPELPPMCFIMLNPSTADASEDDQTIRKCKGFATRHNAGGIEIVNLFAWRSTDPKALRYADAKAKLDIIGPDNDASILAAVNTTFGRDGYVVCAWGANAKFHAEREKDVRNLIFMNCTEAAHSLRITEGGHPGHPCMLPYETPLQDYQL